METLFPLKTILSTKKKHHKLAASLIEGVIVMVRLEHSNLVVNALEPTLDFILTAFPEWQVRGRGKMPWKSGLRDWLHVGDDNYYITLNDNGNHVSRDLQSDDCGLAHLGFEVDDIESLIMRLTNAGYLIDVVGRTHPFRRTVYFVDPSGIQFEFIQYLSRKPSERNMYGGESGELLRYK